jgi:hypothetical protein
VEVDGAVDVGSGGVKSVVMLAVVRVVLTGLGGSAFGRKSSSPIESRFADVRPFSDMMSAVVIE